MQQTESRKIRDDLIKLIKDKKKILYFYLKLLHDEEMKDTVDSHVFMSI